MTQRNGWRQAQTYTELVFWREHRRAKRKAKREARRYARLSWMLSSPPDYPLREVRFGPV